MMRKLDTISSLSRPHDTLEPDTLLLNTLRDRVRALGEMILEITSTALSEAEAFSRKISSATNGSVYMPLNNRINRNVLNTVVKSNHEGGKIIVAVSVINTRDPSILAPGGRHMIEQNSGKSPTARLKRKPTSTIKSGSPHSSVSKDSFYGTARQTNRADDKPWRQNNTLACLPRQKMNERRPSAIQKGAATSKCETNSTASKRAVLWDDERIEQYLRQKPTAGDYQELIARNQVPNAKNRSHTSEISLSGTNSIDGTTSNRDGDNKRAVSEPESFRCYAPLYDRSYEAYVDTAQTQARCNAAEKGATFFSCGSCFTECKKKTSPGRKSPKCVGKKNPPCPGPIETLSGVYHSPGTILKQEAISVEEAATVISKLTENDVSDVTISFANPRARVRSFHLYDSPLNGGSSRSQGVQEGAVETPLSTATARGSPNEKDAQGKPLLVRTPDRASRTTPSSSLVSSCCKMSGSHVLQILPVFTGEPCAVQFPSISRCGSDIIKECV